METESVIEIIMNKKYIAKLINKNIKIRPLEDYISSRVKIAHQCTEGHIWSVEPRRIIDGRGCPICSGRNKKTTEEYIKNIASKSINYIPIEEYKGTHIPILHRCPSGHEWLVRPSHILLGKGCPSCATYRMDPESPAILYYIKINYNNIYYYKIGITSRTIKDRFRDESEIEIYELYSHLFNKAKEALEIEQSILNEFAEHRVGICNILKSGGNTELFNVDVLGFDT